MGSTLWTQRKGCVSGWVLCANSPPPTSAADPTHSQAYPSTLELRPTSGSASQDANNKVPDAQQAPKAGYSTLPVWINKVLLAHLHASGAKVSSCNRELKYVLLDPLQKMFAHSLLT